MRGDRVVLTRTAIVAIGGTYLLMGLVVSSFGPLLEHLTRRFGVSLPVAGSTISVYFAVSLIGVVIAMRTMTRLAARTTVMGAIALFGVGSVAAGFAQSWIAFMAAIVVIGLAFGALDLGLNQLVAYSEGARRAALLNVLNSAYSAGEVVSPLLVASLASAHFTLLFLGAAAIAVVLVPGVSGIAGRLPVASGSPGRLGRLVLVFVLAIVLYVGIENGIGGWMPSHLESIGLRSTQAAGVTSGFWLALVTGRVLMFAMPSRISEAAIVLTGCGVSSVALIFASIPALAPIAYIVAGFFIAPIFPTTIVWLARLRPGDSRATAWLYPAASVGGTLGPGAIGLVIAGFGVSWAPAVLAIVAVSMSAAFFLAYRITSAGARDIDAIT